MEPSSESTWDFNSSKTAARLVLAISAPLSHGKQQQLNNIPSIIYSYAVTMLGRISHCLTEVMNQDTLLAYLSYCSRSTGVNPIDFVKMICQQRLTRNPDNCVKFILANIGEIWHMTKFGCISEVLMTLRSWKEELATFITDPLDFIYNEEGKLGYILHKLESTLRELKYRFIGLSKEEALHIHELMLVVCTLRLSMFDSSFHESALTQLCSAKSRVMLLYEDRSIEPCRFVRELVKILQKNDTCDIFWVRELLEFFSIKQLVFCGNFRYMKAEVDVGDNDSASFCGKTICWIAIEDEAT
ncbi:hypothetical protein L6452_41922 [Arctium lappa]|uniref:Uncharacterized protein n=1 Tax=Arctium lappa TaxID=4217 RepID=A0ACB8XH27_ARCLA|nr:hypothetical protein L6452_41922 [Arctium lappa]